MQEKNQRVKKQTTKKTLKKTEGDDLATEQMNENVIDFASQTKELSVKNEELVDMVKRIQAEFDNFRKRNASLKQESIDDGVVKAALELIPVLDTIQIALSTFSTLGKGDSGKYQEGLRRIEKQFLDQLETLRIKPIECLHEQFDPNCHHAVMQEESDSFESGTIIEEMQRGYTFKDKVIRYSLVKVAI